MSNESPTPPKSTAATGALPANGPRAPRPASSADRVNYAAREAASPEAKNFQGGEGAVVIGASTATVILAVILLVVLL